MATRATLVVLQTMPMRVTKDMRMREVANKGMRIMVVEARRVMGVVKATNTLSGA